ncbi:MAG: hypothetical protein EHM36_00105 [Deltaproteobacteria bacterium]|nr:MAG: hypothetical protein EHM36_00105 [Deltaproteobacteria bacterium]
MAATPMPADFLKRTPCPKCGLSSGGHTKDCIDGKLDDLPSEEVRHAIETIRKWSSAVGKKWVDIRSRMVAAGLSQEMIVPLGKPKPLCSLNADYECVLVDRNKTDLSHVMKNLADYPDFDVAQLPEIRKLVTQFLDQCEQKIKDVHEEKIKAKEERKKKMNEILPAIVDEFGADIMTYGGPEIGKMQKDGERL